MGYLGTQMEMFDLFLARTKKDSQWIRGLDRKNYSKQDVGQWKSLALEKKIFWSVPS